MRESAHETWTGSVVRKKATVSAIATAGDATPLTKVFWKPAVSRKFIVSKAYIKIVAIHGSVSPLSVALSNGVLAANVAAAVVVDPAAELIPVVVKTPPVIVDFNRPLTVEIAAAPAFTDPDDPYNTYDYELIIFAEKVSA